MSNVTRTDIDALNAVLAVTLTKEEYLGKVNKDIKRYTQKAQRPGFRPGKTPTSLIKRLYGDSFVIEAIQEMMSQRLGEYLNENKPDIFGQPIMSEKQSEIGFDPKNPQDITFSFDIGLIPPFEVEGLDGVAYERYLVNVSDEKVDAEIENMRKRTGEELEVDTNIQDGDMITLHIKEQGGTLEKEDLLLSMNWITEEMKDVFYTQKRGDSLTINIFQLEKETTPQYVRKYFLGIEETDDREINENFDATIKFVKRITPVEINQAFFDNNFGEGVVTSEAQMREIIRGNLRTSFDGQADGLLLRDVQDGLIAANNIALPEGFLKRWLRTQNENNTAEAVDKGFVNFTQNLRWTLIRSKIAKTSEISITDDDLKDFYRMRIRGYLGGMAGNDDLIENLVERVMKDEKQMSDLYEEVLTEKTFQAMKSRVKIVDKPIGEEEFNSIMAAAQYEAAKARGEIDDITGNDTLDAAEDAVIEEVEAEEV